MDVQLAEHGGYLRWTYFAMLKLMSVNAVNNDLIISHASLSQNTALLSMNVNSCKKSIWRLWPRSGEWNSLAAWSGAIKKANEAVKRFPRSSALWCLRGETIGAITLYCDTEHHIRISRTDALHCYKKAISLNKKNAEAYEEMGYYYYIADDVSSAKEAFATAIKLRAGCHSYIGLAKVLLENGERSAALSLLKSRNCPLRNHPRVKAFLKDVMMGN